MSKRGAKGTGRAGGGKRARPAVAPLVEDPPDPRASLEAEGYVFWRGAVPARLCEPLAAAVEAEIDEQLNAGSPCQEIPSEHLSDGTAARLREMQAWVIEHVLRPRLKPAACEVPHWWPQTLYGRLKKRHFHTSYHCDALNTVVELGRGELQLGRRVGEALPGREQRLRAGPHGKGRCLSSGGSGTHKAKCGVSAVKAVGTQGKRRRLSREGS